VGFGRQTTVNFTQTDRYGVQVAQLQTTITQDAHNSYLWLLAGGGIACLASFLLVLLVFFCDALRRARNAVDEHERIIVVWSMATVFVFLLNALTGPVLSNAMLMLAIWTLLLLPSIVRKRSPVDVHAT
jgi:O-antigen ligase